MRKAGALDHAGDLRRDVERLADGRGRAPEGFAVEVYGVAGGNGAVVAVPVHNVAFVDFEKAARGQVAALKVSFLWLQEARGGGACV